MKKRADRVPIFVPTESTVAASQMTAFARYCREKTGRLFPDHAALHAFSCSEFAQFWELFLAWSELPHTGDLQPVYTDSRCEKTTFFPRLQLSYAANLLRVDDDDDGRPALTACHSEGLTERLSRTELRESVARLALGLRRVGLRPGDRVVAIAGNNAEAVIAALAVLALGATFSAASPEMGASAILARFGQLAPAMLICSLSPHGGSARGTERLREVVAALPSLKAIVDLSEDELDGFDPRVFRMNDLMAGQLASDFEWPLFPFNHPIFILFTSGTTGRPKCLIHGAGGTLLEHCKEHRLHCDLRRGDKLFFQTSCAWMMWNWQLSGLASGVEIVLYDGRIEGPATLWNVVGRERVTVFGTNPSYLQMCEEAEYIPSGAVDLSALRALLSTGSILHDRQFLWVRNAVKLLPLQSISGGTDIIGCFMLGNPNLPIHAGEIQCRSLGMDVVAEGASAPGGIGELVCRTPFPSRPLGLYGDPDGVRFHAAYFARHPGVWTHGDFIAFTADGAARVHGRSDGVLNIRGVRVGPAEIYQILQGISEIREALAVEQRVAEATGGSRMVLIVVLRHGRLLDGQLILRIKKELARRGSPAHVPEIIAQVPELPITHSGKRSEQAARAAINGEPIPNLEALANPDSTEGLRRHPAFALRDRASVPGPSASLEEELRAIWEDIFRVAPIELDDDFFEMGGHSVLAFQMMLKIRARLGQELPVTTLVQASSVRTLAAAIRLMTTETPASCIVPLKTSGRGRPFFIAPGFGGNILELVKIARHISADRPIYALQARGLRGNEEPHRRIEEMAEYYLGHITAMQGSGPYALAGYSSGGLVAFEMARRLQKAGQTIELVALLDTGLGERNFPLAQRLSHGVSRAYSKSKRTLEILGWMLELPRSEKLGYLGGVIDLSLRRHGHSWMGRPAGEAELPEHFVRMRHAGLEAIASYRPAPYSGTIAFFRSLSPDPLREDPLPVWRRVASTAEVYDVPGTHESIIVEPNVACLGKLLTAALTRKAVEYPDHMQLPRCTA